MRSGRVVGGVPLNIDTQCKMQSLLTHCAPVLMTHCAPVLMMTHCAHII